jgi:hypothetical protein
MNVFKISVHLKLILHRTVPYEYTRIYQSQGLTQVCTVIAVKTRTVIVPEASTWKLVSGAST